MPVSRMLYKQYIEGDSQILPMLNGRFMTTSSKFFANYLSVSSFLQFSQNYFVKNPNLRSCFFFCDFACFFFVITFEPNKIQTGTI